MNKKLEILEIVEKGFAIISLVFYSSGPLPLILSHGMGEGLVDITPDPTDYSSLQRLFFISYFVTFSLLIFRWKRTLYVVSKEWTISLLIPIALASIMWSFVPTQTQPRAFALIGTSCFGLYLAAQYSIREQLKLLGWSFFAIIIMSFLMAIIIPDYGTMPIGIHAGAWRGIYVHKNVLGRMMTIGGMVFLILAMNAKEQKWLPWIGLGLSIWLLILSKSSSSIINFITIFAIVPIYSILRWRYEILIPTVIALITLGGSLSVWFSQNASTVLGSIGKDATLTGRTDIWPLIIEMIGKQPWLGYGYSAFWNSWDSPGAYVWYAARWTPPNAHNGLLDLWLDLGLLGVLVFMTGFVTTCVRGLVWLRIDRSWDSFWTLLYLTYLVLANLSESSLLNRNDIFWVLYVSVSFSLATVRLNQDKALNQPFTSN